MATLDEKIPSGSSDWLSENPLVSAFRDSYNNFQIRRAALGLSNPGTVENVAAEVTKGVFLNNMAFTGLSANLTKVFSMAPLFQVQHAFGMGLGGQGSPPPYGFTALFGNNRTFLNANLDNEGALSARFNVRLNERMVSRFSAQMAPGPGQAMFSAEQDYTGADCTASIKTFNPSYLEGSLTGIFIASYLQSITPSLSAGLEAVWQRQSKTQIPESAVSYVARYQGVDWVASAQWQAQGALHATFFKRVGERVEAGVESQLSFAPGMMGGIRKEGITTLAAKYDFRMATMRAQVDTTGKLSCLLEKRVAPMVTLTFSGEMDHFKNTAKVGLAVQIENVAEELESQQPAPMSIPF